MHLPSFSHFNFFFDKTIWKFKNKSIGLSCIFKLLIFTKMCFVFTIHLIRILVVYIKNISIIIIH